MLSAIPSPDSSDTAAKLAAEPVNQGSVPSITAEELLRGHREIVILHGDAVYRLRLTRNGKLILQK